MENLTPDQLQTTVYVILALFGSLITVDKVLDIFKKWRAPAKNAAEDVEKNFPTISTASTTTSGSLNSKRGISRA